MPYTLYLTLKACCLFSKNVIARKLIRAKYAHIATAPTKINMREKYFFFCCIKISTNKAKTYSIKFCTVVCVSHYRVFSLAIAVGAGMPYSYKKVINFVWISVSLLDLTFS